MAIYYTLNKAKLYIGATKVKNAYLGTAKIYSSGNIVTYMMDGKVYHAQEYEEGQSVLSPSKSPSKSGYTFLGWSTSASGNVLTSLTMNDSPITLYAIFVQAAAWNFAYTGGVQSFVVPVSGLYKLNVLGASGFSNYGRAGKGGSSTGYVFLNKNSVLYIVVGGTNGYNGGGTGVQIVSNKSGAGGGCTHIGTFNSTLAAHGAKSGLYIVAGGGGGDSFGYGVTCYGGSGGGINGENTSASSSDNSPPISTGGTQTDSGHVTNYQDNPGGFGRGANPRGGGGLYGGGSGGAYWGSGAGGSGYIGGVPTITHKGKTYSPSTSNGTNNGNGSASIQFIAA